MKIVQDCRKGCRKSVIPPLSNWLSESFRNWEIRVSPLNQLWIKWWDWVMGSPSCCALWRSHFCGHHHIIPHADLPRKPASVCWSFFMCLLLVRNTKETFSMFQKMKHKPVSPSGYLYLQSGTIATLHGGHANNTPTSLMCCLHGVKLESKLFPPTPIHSKFPLANLVGTECLHDAILLRLAFNLITYGSCNRW